MRILARLPTAKEIAVIHPSVQLSPRPRRRLLAQLTAFLVVIFAGALPVRAALDESLLQPGIVVVSVLRGEVTLRRGSGFVLQSDRFSGYVLASATLLDGATTITVSAHGTAGALVAQRIAVDEEREVVLLKVNGLFAEPLTFVRTPPAGEPTVWSVQRYEGEGGFLVSSQGRIADVVDSTIRHSATVRAPASASVLVNECGFVLGFNLPPDVVVRTPGDDYLMRAVSAAALSTFLGEYNISLDFAANDCVSAIALAREEAARASSQAELAARNAEQARRVASELEAALRASSEKNANLVAQARLAQDRADAAIAAAEAARDNAAQTQAELERETTALKAETDALMRFLAQDRAAAEARFREALADQQAAARSRERLWIALVAVGVLAAIGFAVLWVRRATMTTATSGSRIAAADSEANEGRGRTVMHNEALVEYVLDGRDEDGIRYLLRISGDQLKGGEGVVIGRNPEDSPYIINHADVSRRHARMKVMKNRVFIEDLGSTNGTSVNGQSIDDKGPVSVDNGDQIIIGSVVMKLRVLGA